MAKKISIFIVILALIITVVPIKVYAGSIFDEVINPELFAPKDEETSGEILDIVNPILGTIQVIGSIVAVAALMAIGIKYMMGSIEEKAQYKETMVPYVIGIVLLFIGVNILKFAAEIISKILK